MERRKCQGPETVVSRGGQVERRRGQKEERAAERGQVKEEPPPAPPPEKNEQEKSGPAEAGLFGKESQVKKK